MNRTVVASIVALGATVGDAPPPGTLPWLHGLDGLRLGQVRSGSAEPPDGCGVGSTVTWELRANLAASDARQTITASFLGGVEIRDHRGRVLEHLPGSACEGTSDEVVALAAARLDGAPVIVVATVRGGRREAETEVSLYRPGPAHALDAIFVGTVERWEADSHVEGAVWLRGDRLFYQPPEGGVYAFTFDPIGRTYVPNGRVDRAVVPHVPPDV
jgi:hypothetical protein